MPSVFFCLICLVNVKLPRNFDYQGMEWMAEDIYG